MIELVLDGRIEEIEHIGSTSVEGLAAKPIIDIGITVTDIDDPTLIDRMQKLGYIYRDDREDDLPFRRYFVLIREDKHLVHVHIVPKEHEFFNAHIAFRDYLRQHKDIRDEYHLLKIRLAHKYKEDREGYQQGKSAYIRNITDLALDQLQSLD